MTGATHTKCTTCRGFGSVVVQEECTGCRGKGCRQCKEGKVPAMKRCEPCKGEGYIETGAKTAYYDHG